jgi:cytochrome c553
MRKIVYAIFVAALLIGCGDDKPKEKESVVSNVDVSEIKVTQGQKRVEEVEDKHEDELKKDKKGFYYAYDEKDNSDSSSDETFTRVDAQKRVKNKVVDGKVAVVERDHTPATPYQYIRIDLLKNALSHDFMVKCSACHDDYANGVIGPSLLEKDGDYIYSQMLKYRSDPSKNILMYELVNNMSEEKLKSLADEVAQFNKEIRALKEKNK